MRRNLVCLPAALMVLALSGLALAQSQTPPPAAPTPPAAGTPAQPATPSAAMPQGKAAVVKHMAGEVVSVNAATKSLTLRHTVKKKAKELTFTLAGDAAGHLTDYKPGDSVRVTYHDEAGSLVAQSVTRSKHAAKAKK